MRIWDGFTFFNEFELLKIRCEELKDVPNLIHVLVESPFTFTAKEKPLYFLERKDEFKKYNICHVISNFIPNKTDAWENEKNQRNAIMSGITDANDLDPVIISDVDEIPFAKTILEYDPKMFTAALIMNKTGYWLNCIEGYQSWKIAKILPYEMLAECTPDIVRNSGQENFIENAGWHFSYLGAADAIRTKLDSFSHVETNTEKLRNSLEYKIESGQSLWGEDFWKIVSIDDSFPKYVIEHQHDSLQHLIKQI